LKEILSQDQPLERTRVVLAYDSWLSVDVDCKSEGLAVFRKKIEFEVESYIFFYLSVKKLK